MGREAFAGLAVFAVEPTPAAGVPRPRDAPSTARVAPAEEGLLIVEAGRAEKAPPTVEVAPAGGVPPARGVTRAPVPPSLVETRRISEGLPDAVMLGRRVEWLTAEARWVAKLLVIASLSRFVDDLPGLLARLEGAARLACSAPPADEVPSAEKSLVAEIGLRSRRRRVEERRRATIEANMERLSPRVSPWVVELVSNEWV